MRPTFNKNERGLTLIEMMLVVTVIAVATLSTMKILRTRTSSTQIDQIAIQMQNVGQGVINYYMLNNTWPTTSTSPSSLLTLTEGSANPVFFSPQTLCTPFSDTTQNSALCRGYSLIQGQALNSTSYYQVVLKADSENAALAIANKLPDATVNGMVITMSVLAPAQSFLHNPNQGWIVSAGVTNFSTNNTVDQPAITITAGTPIILPNCPARFEGHIIFAPLRYQTYGPANQDLFNPINAYGIHITQATVNASGVVAPEAQLINSTSLGCCTLPYTTIPGFNGGPSPANATSVYDTGKTEANSAGQNNTVYAVRLADQPENLTQTGVYHHTAYYITMCVPLGHWVSVGIHYDWMQDGQCSGESGTLLSWSKFLLSGNPSIPKKNLVCQSIATNKSIPVIPARVMGSPNAY